jgi:hypothetical protein
VLGIESAPGLDDAHRHLIITVGSSTLSLIVDDVGEVLELIPHNYFTDRGGLEAPFKELVVGIYQSMETTVLHSIQALSDRMG